jgi:DNA-binding NarL/FixJ family response regulator
MVGGSSGSNASALANALTQTLRFPSSLAALGRSNKLIAYELGLAQPTVRILMARAARKLGVRSRAELITRIEALSTKG